MERSGIINLGIEGLMLIGALLRLRHHTIYGELLPRSARILRCRDAGWLNTRHSDCIPAWKPDRQRSFTHHVRRGESLPSSAVPSWGGLIEGFSRIDIPFLSKIPVIGAGDIQSRYTGLFQHLPCDMHQIFLL